MIAGAHIGWAAVHDRPVIRRHVYCGRPKHSFFLAVTGCVGWLRPCMAMARFQSIERTTPLFSPKIAFVALVY